MRLEKARLVEKVRNMKMKGMTDNEISLECKIAKSTVYKYNSRNMLNSPYYVPTRRARKVRLLKVVTLLKERYKLTFASTYKFLNSIGFKVTKDTLRGVWKTNR